MLIGCTQVNNIVSQGELIEILIKNILDIKNITFEIGDSVEFLGVYTYSGENMFADNTEQYSVISNKTLGFLFEKKKRVLKRIWLGFRWKVFGISGDGKRREK